MWQDIYPKDRVITKRGKHKGTVTHVWRNGIGDKVCNVKFDDQSLIPSEMEYMDYELEIWDDPWSDDHFYGKGGRCGPIEDYCPNCGTAWTVTTHPIHGSKTIWKDCKPCGKTYERITKKKV